MKIHGLVSSPGNVLTEKPFFALCKFIDVTHQHNDNDISGQLPNDEDVYYNFALHKFTGVAHQ